MEICGSDDNRWYFARVNKLIEEEKAKGTTLVLPIVTLVETGKHIAQARIKDAAAQTSPRAAFGAQFVLWNAEELKKLAAQWPHLAAQQTSMGDATIKIVGQFYAEKGYQVEFLTADEQLKAQDPSPPARTQKKRRSGN
ncbi:hypothetical protein MiSe_29950 [Microseira wollei NIES-4236]|uniref:PIN domain-containing protein n=2 Tax=Microseira wollei TaxID=467598 RepID=A0AAV3XA36_9CYAN|nr:hypothetical protein MiSe_29950 [Microseira wollei NIES-4236]